MSDAVVITLVTGVVSLLGTIFTGVMAYFMAQLNSKANRASETRHKIDEKLTTHNTLTNLKLEELANVGSKTQKTTEEVKVLVNGSMKAQLKLNMMALKRIAELTGTPEDKAAADLATRIYEAQK